MSSALVRQALEFVDQEESSGKRGKRRANERRPAAGQDHRQLYKRKNKRAATEIVSRPTEQQAEENIKKLLALSKPTTDPNIAEKIVERAVKGKPLLEKIEVRKEEEKSILFPDEEPFKKFEKEYFCS